MCDCCEFNHASVIGNRGNSSVLQPLSFLFIYLDMKEMIHTHAFDGIISDKKKITIICDSGTKKSCLI